jgi:glycosyltransferase involved in cell wall biosynthesis
VLEGRRALRVAILDPIGRGSLSRYAATMGEALVAMGVEATLVTSGCVQGWSWPSSLRVENRLAGGNREHGRPRRALAYVVSLVALLRWLQQGHFDVVHLHESFVPAVDVALAHLLAAIDLPLVYTAHDPDHDYAQRIERPAWSLRRWSLEALFRQADAVICLSNAARAHLLTVKGVTPEKISLVTHANYLSMREGRVSSKAEARRRLGIPRDRRVALLFGGLKETKGFGHLLEAFARLRTRLPQALLLVAGEPRPGFDVAQLRHGVVREALDGALLLCTGFVPEEQLPLYFQAADIVTLPYLRVYQSGVLHVAYAFGRPVVASAVGSLIEDVRHGRSGLLVRPGDTQALGQAMGALLEDDDMRRRMGRYAYQMAQEPQYSWQETARKTLAVYERVLRGGNGTS